MSQFDYFAKALWVQLFYSFAMTILVYSMAMFVPLNQVELFTNNVGPGVDDIAEDIEGSFENQFNIPVVDLGSLVFFSGNILADLILNFITAIPNMVNILISAFFLFIPVEAQLQTNIKIFIVVALTIGYMLGTLAFLANMRTGRAI